MNKRIRGLAAALVMAAVLAGCWGPTEPSEKDPKSDTDGDGKGTGVGFIVEVATPRLG